jgi:hypothetical protein
MTAIDEWIKSNRSVIGKVCRYGVTRLLGALGHVGLLAIFVKLISGTGSAHQFCCFIYDYCLYRLRNKLRMGFPKCLDSFVFLSAIPDKCSGCVFTQFDRDFVTVNIWGWWDVWGQLSATVIVPAVNALISFYWSFR